MNKPKPQQFKPVKAWALFGPGMNQPYAYWTFDHKSDLASKDMFHRKGSSNEILADDKWVRVLITPLPKRSTRTKKNRR